MQTTRLVTTNDGHTVSHYVENLDTESHSLWQQWLQRHQPEAETASVHRMMPDTPDWAPPAEFDELMDYLDNADQHRQTIHRHIVTTAAARGEAMVIEQVLAGYRGARNDSLRRALEERGYTDIPEPWRDTEEIVNEDGYE